MDGDRETLLRLLELIAEHRRRVTEAPSRRVRGTADDAFAELTHTINQTLYPEQDFTRFSEPEDGHPATVRLHGGDVFRGVLRRTRKGWRMGDPVRGDGIVLARSVIAVCDLSAPPRCPVTGRPLTAEISDVRHVPELDL